MGGGHGDGYTGSAQGYTLVELLVVVAIVAGLMVMAAPFLSRMLQDNRLITQINRLHGTLQFARTEAIKRGSSLTVCAAANGLTCGGSWHDGWIVLSGTGILRTVPKLTGNTTLSFILTAGGASDRIVFNARGFSPNHAGTFRLCDSRGAGSAKGLITATTGRPLLATDHTGNGIAEDDTGSELTCP
ncbi:MAG: GspH/FimT family pseudopilin [Magnetococcales bacterium]|nr:GspH/FimT family pseudopilin [Magnetococcales bacterium]